MPTNPTFFSVALTLAAVSPAFAGLITFDDIPAGRIGEQYLDRGVMFYVGNGEFGTSTDLLFDGPDPLTAYAGSFNTSISQPNIMNPGGGPNVPGNSDIIIHFFDTTGARTFANEVGIFNDTDGNPFTIYIEGFDINGDSLGRTQINGGGAGGVFTSEGIYSASIYAASGQFGLIGVDDFSYTLVPTPSSMAVLSVIGLSATRRHRRTE